MTWTRIIQHKAEAYKYELVLGILHTIAFVLVAYTFWGIMVHYGANIPGWTLKDLVFFALLMDFAVYVDGLLYYFLPTPTMIRQGELTTILLKPAPVWKVLFPYRVGAEDVYATALKGILVFWIGIMIGYSPKSLLIGLLLMAVGAIIDNATYASVIYTNFFVGDARPLVIAFDEIWAIAREHPVDAYKKSAMFWVLTFIVPLYFLGTLPMHYIMGHIDRYILLLPVLLGVWFFIAKTLWNIGLKRWEAYGG
jgi:ABC-2 type transport system permease protein